MKQIKDATDIFSYIDSDFSNLNVKDTEGTVKREVPLDIYDLTEDKTFKQMFTDPENQWVTQEEVIDFCKNRKKELSSWFTFFLLKSGNGLFVADVRVCSDGLYVFVRLFEDDYAWLAEYAHRVVVPHLGSQSTNKDSFTPEHSDTLLERLDKLESWARNLGMK